jgi:hypothetical protein
MRLPLPIRRQLLAAALSRVPALACALPLALSGLLAPSVPARAVPAPRVADPVAAALARPVDAARYPQAGAVVLLDAIRVSLDPQGRRTVEHHVLLKILQDRALRELSDQKVPFRGDTERCEVLTALTHLPDGSTRKPEAEGLMEVSDPEAASAPFYSNARLKVVSFPAVQIGAVLELKYRITPRADASADSLEPFTGERVLGGDEPILDQTLVLTVPAGTGLKYQMFAGAPAPKVTPGGTSDQYAWTLRDVPQLLSEPGMVPAVGLVPRVAWTVVPGREQLGRWLYQRFQAAARPDPAVTAQARALTAGLASPEARVERLALFVTREIQDVALGLGRVGYRPTAAPVILANRYADLRDKYVLFQALLEAVDLQARPLLVHQERVPMSELACLGEYQGLLARVELPSGPRFYNLTQSRARLGELMPVDGARPALLVGPAGGQACTTPAVDQRTQFLRAQWQMALDAQGDLKGRITFRFGGCFDQQVRSQLFGRNQDERRVLFQEEAGRIKQGTRLDGFHVSDLLDLTAPPEVTLDVVVPAFACRQGDMMILNLPGDLALLGVSPVHPALPEMHHPFLVPATFAMEGTFSVDLPPGYRIAYQPATAQTHDPAFDFQIRSGARPGGLLLERSLVWQEGVVAPGAYPAMWRAFGRTTMPGNALVLLEQDPAR